MESKLLFNLLMNGSENVNSSLKEKGRVQLNVNYVD